MIENRNVGHFQHIYKTIKWFCGSFLVIRVFTKYVYWPFSSPKTYTTKKNVNTSEVHLALDLLLQNFDT